LKTFNYLLAGGENMNWDLLLPLLVTTVVALSGWFVAHLLASHRDRTAKRRETRTAYLIEAYRRFESVCHRPPLGRAEVRDLESAVADIQLFGTPEQISLVDGFIRQYSVERSGNVDPLLASLRSELRSELGLGRAADSTFFLRVTFDDTEEQKG